MQIIHKITRQTHQDLALELMKLKTTNLSDQRRSEHYSSFFIYKIF